LSAGIATAQNGAYRFQPDKTYKYLCENKSTIIQEAMGQSATLSVEGTVGTVYRLDSRLANGDMHVFSTVENAIAIVESPDGMKTFGADLTGKQIGFTMRSDGEMLDHDSITFKVENESEGLLSQISQIFPQLNVEKISNHEGWEVKSIDTSDLSEDNLILTTSTSKFEVKGMKSTKNRECVEIALHKESEIEGHIVRGGDDLNLTGTQTSDGTILYDAAQGILFEMTLEQTGDQTIAKSGSSMKMTMTSSGSTKVEYIPE